MLGSQRNKDGPPAGWSSTSCFQASRVEWSSSPHQVCDGYYASWIAPRHHSQEGQASECNKGHDTPDNPMACEQSDDGSHDASDQKEAPRNPEPCKLIRGE